MGDRTSADWEAIEREYRAGQLSVSEIGRLYGLSHTAIQKRAKRDSWTRDLAAKVRQEVSARLVADPVASCNTREAVDNAATRAVQVIREHRADIGRGRTVCSLLLSELENATLKIDEIEDAIELETAGDANSNRRQTMLKAVSLSNRCSSVIALSGALKNLVALERQSFNLDDGGPIGDESQGGTFTVRFVRPAGAPPCPANPSSTSPNDC